MNTLPHLTELETKPEAEAEVIPYNAKAIAEGKQLVNMQIRRLTVMLYQLMYDHLPIGAVEHLVYSTIGMCDDPACDGCEKRDEAIHAKAEELANAIYFYFESEHYNG